MKLLGITLLSAQAISLDRQEASQFLSRRQRRETGESRDDLELECIEKRCSAEELDEVYDFETGLWKVQNFRSQCYNNFIRIQLTTMATHTNRRINVGFIVFLLIKRIPANAKPSSENVWVKLKCRSLSLRMETSFL